MHKEAVYHEAHGKYAYPVGPNTLRVILRAKKGDLKRCVIVYQDRYSATDEFIEDMEKVASDELFDYFQSDITLETKRFMYTFLLDDGINRVRFTEKGFYQDPPPLTEFHYPYIAIQDQWETPRWSQGSVVYQIFPERFANGTTTNDPQGVEPWELKPTRESQKGGDLQGIIDKLDHLVELGVEVLYMTPIFESPSNHKYDTTDYYKIDPHFGDLSTCKKLVNLCHENGIKVVFDAVFNHCGFNFFAFQDVLENGEQSRYKDWFNIYSFPVKTMPPNYETFANDVYTMPKLMTHNPEVREYLLRVATYWLEECGIDGWRLDVANEIDHDFWREFRKRVKAVNPEAVIIGEVWHEASEWVEGDQFDAVMNYPFRDSCVDFFAKGTIKAETFAHRMAKVRMNHRQTVNRSMYNLIDSHDTARFLTSASDRVEKLKLAAACQLTFEGSPMIYYGTEFGMVGENDPDCRRGMLWDEASQEREIFQWYKQLINIRKSHPVLVRGDQRTVLADSATNVIGYVRFNKTDQVLILINNSPYERRVTIPDGVWPLAVPKQVTDLITGETIKEVGTLTLPANGVLILK